MPDNEFTQLIDEIRKRQSLVKTYLQEEQHRLDFDLEHLQDAVYSYVDAGGKALRAAVLLFCCGAVGGDELTAIPAAAAVELYHTFTLVHDDIIDRDRTRRGIPTVHAEFEKRAVNEFGFEEDSARHYGLTVAILAGDIQQGWAASLLPDLYLQHAVPAQLVLRLIQELFRTVQVTLMRGEALDVLQAYTPVEQLSETQVLEMLWQKTGALYEYCGRAGAAIGLCQPDRHHPTIESMAAFTGRCGLAFQIQDDILGIIGDEEQLGKPVGSDIREGKRTIIVLHSLPRMTSSQRAFTLKTLGNHDASPADIQDVSELLRATGGVQHARNTALTYIQEARTFLEPLPESHYKELLETWAAYIINRLW